jgi:hypothetical protein
MNGQVQGNKLSRYKVELLLPLQPDKEAARIIAGIYDARNDAFSPG